MSFSRLEQTRRRPLIDEESARPMDRESNDMFNHVKKQGWFKINVVTFFIKSFREKGC